MDAAAESANQAGMSRLRLTALTVSAFATVIGVVSAAPASADVRVSRAELSGSAASPGSCSSSEGDPAAPVGDGAAGTTMGE